MNRPKSWRSGLQKIAVVAAIAAATVGAVWGWQWATPDLEELYDQAMQAVKDEKTQEAADLFDRVLDQDPEHNKALLYRGAIAQELGEFDAAQEYWSRVSDESPTDKGTALYLAGKLALDEKQARKAEELLRSSIRLHPNYHHSRRVLAELYATQMRRHPARKQLAAMIALQPPSIEHLAMFAMVGEPIVYVNVGIERLESYVDVDPDDVESWLGLANYYMLDHRHGDAVEKLGKLLIKHPKHERLAARYLEALIEHDLSAAKEVVATYPLTEDSHAWLWRSYGRLALKIGEWDDAVTSLTKAVEGDPYDYVLRYWLGLALQRAGRIEEGDKELDLAKSMDQVRAVLYLFLHDKEQPIPEAIQPTVFMSVARELMRMERPGEAIQWMNRMRASQNDAFIQVRYDRATRQLEKSGLGIEGWQPPPDSESREIRPFPTELVAELSETGNVRIPDVRFRAVEKEAGVEFKYFNGDTGFKYIFETMGGGVALLDYDGDGQLDIYFTQGAPVPYDEADEHTDRLFRNLGDGTFEDVTQAAGLGSNYYGLGCSAADYDNDGDMDIVVANYGPNRFYQNNGDGTFSDLSNEMGFVQNVLSTSAAFADLNRDGLLELYIANYVEDPERLCYAKPGVLGTCLPQRFDAAQDWVYFNQGDGTYRDVTETSGIVAENGKGFGIIIADFDEDDWPDIYVANDTTANFLFRNQGQQDEGFKFLEQGFISGTAYSGHGASEAGMGVACGDLDGDGRLDLYVTNFYQETNTLYLNRGACLFTDATSSAQLDLPTNNVLGFGTQTVDADLDGNLELFVANGHIDIPTEEGTPWKMPPQLFYNLGDSTFTEISKDSGDYFEGEYLGRGVARGDLNGDGKPDLVIVYQDVPVTLLVNETEEVGNRIGIRLIGTESNREGIGTKFWVTAGGVTRFYQLLGGDGFFAANDRKQLFGVGESVEIESLEILWPSGKRQEWENVKANAEYTIIEGSDPIATKTWNE